ncbi:MULTISPECIES: NAD(P)H-dependent oxidoreductase [Prosthecochloris]|uniref:NAD(P)H-dependent oxidoreductase n=1 Tax=Prosthecochloris TaxID=1101 RepID=UPI00080AB6B1|nr:MULTISPECIES: NAD(P)H-dependent oxidoreductase [Prosthecochloris]ANT63883.1 General stress protein 14 [Prosthecochloris sp. CIB 2401]
MEGNGGVGKILIVFAHPAFEKSRVNRQLMRELASVPGVTLHDLYEQYPDGDIDVVTERECLEEHDVILFQFPLFLFGIPALLKEWMDLVLVHGWAFGQGGGALRGKLFSCVLSTGGSRSSYSKTGANRFTVRELLAPLEQVANLCRMRFLPPFVVHGTNVITREGIQNAAAGYRVVLQRLGDDAPPQPGDFDEGAYLNDILSAKEDAGHA